MAVFASRKLAPPVITAECKTFFDAARQGRFLIPVCTACNRPHWYPRGLPLASERAMPVYPLGIWHLSRTAMNG
jgi:hypothetical protein